MAIINPNGSLPVDILSGAGSIDIDAWIREVTGDLGQLIRNLFSQSEQGFAYDINDLSTLFQDAAGTIPVTGAGQPVGLIKDKSGNGYNAFQNSAARRPLLRDAPRRIDFDGVDDRLTAPIPVDIPGCTLVRSVPNVGTKVLTNVNLSVSFNDSTDHCGLIVINRALTQTETAQITQIFNRLAGV